MCVCVCVCMCVRVCVCVYLGMLTSSLVAIIVEKGEDAVTHVLVQNNMIVW